MEYNSITIVAWNSRHWISSSLLLCLQGRLLILSIIIDPLTYHAYADSYNEIRTHRWSFLRTILVALVFGRLGNRIMDIAEWL